MAGSKPGERRGGRQKGTPNKATADIKALAQEHTEAAMKELVRIFGKSESDAARVAAIKEIFDRGFGRPKQALDVDASLDGQLTIITGVRRANRD